MIDLGTLTDEYEKEISIQHHSNQQGRKTILAGKEVTIVDTVKLNSFRHKIPAQKVGRC